MASGTRNKPWRRTIFVAARLIHLYVSTLLFGLLLFFCVTGITLNHRWYDKSDESVSLNRSVSVEQLHSWGVGEASQWDPDLPKILDFMEEAFDLPPAHSIDIDVELAEINFEFKVPAGFASVLLAVEEQTMYVDMEKGGVLSIVNDLHKGRYSGSLWFWLIDISAACMIVFSLTGMIIVFQGKKNRLMALLSCCAGIFSPVLLYLIFVPQLGV